MSAGGIAALIAAVAFVLLVGAIAVPLLRLGRLLASLERDVVRGQVVPMLDRTTGTISQVSAELARVEEITAGVQTITTEAGSVATNVSAMTSLVAATLGSPLIKVAAFSYGVRRALGRAEKEQIAEVVREVAKQQKAADRTERRSRRGA